MMNVFSALWRLIISRRFAITLLIIISVLLLLGILLPTLSYHEPEEMVRFKKDHPVLFKMGEVFNPPALATSWTFITLAGLLMISTLACTIERLRNHDFEDPYSKPGYFRRRSSKDTPKSAESVENLAKKTLRSSRWHVTSDAHGDKKVISGSKGAVGFWGSIVFHFAFLIILMGVIISAQNRLNGAILITEGQTLGLDEQSFTQFLRRPDKLELPAGSLTLKKLDKTYEGDGEFAIDYSTWLTFTDAAGQSFTEDAKVNKAVNYHGLAFLMENYGYAPKFVVKDKNKTLVDAFFNLKGREPGSEDFFTIPDTDINIKTVFLPDFARRNGKLINRSKSVKNPAFTVNVEKDGKTIYSGLLPKDKKIKFGKYSLSFDDMRHWAYLRVKRDSGVGLIFWGFVFSFVGLVIRFTFHERAVNITITPGKSGSKIVVSGKSRYFPALFAEEIKRLAAHLAKTS